MTDGTELPTIDDVVENATEEERRQALEACARALNSEEAQGGKVDE